MVEKLLLDPFLKKTKLSISLSWLIVLILCSFVLLCGFESYRNILKRSCWPLAIASCKAFLKSKKWSGTSLPVTFCAWFLKKTIYFAKFYQSCTICVCNYLFSKFWCHKFWIQHYLSNQVVFSSWSKS